MSEIGEFLMYLALDLFIVAGLYSFFVMFLNIFGEYFESICRMRMGMFYEEQYKHYMAALEQKEIYVYSFRKMCQYGFNEPKDAYYVIAFDDGSTPLYLNGQIVVQSRFRAAIDNLREKRGKEFEYENEQK